MIRSINYGYGKPALPAEKREVLVLRENRIQVRLDEIDLGVSRLILGAPRRNALMNLLRGNVIREVSSSLPEEIDLLVYA
jgi:hypothetical protein